jgi:hypothetical protein
LHAKAEPERPPERSEIGRALALLFGGTGLLAGVALVWSPITGWLQALLALMLLGVPTLVLRGTGTVIDDLGVDLGPARRTLRVAALVMILLTPLYALGFHLVHGELLDKSANWSTSHLSRWDDAIRDTPPAPCKASADTVLAWTTGDALWVVPPSGKTLTLTLEDAPVDRPKVTRCGADGTLRARRLLGRSGDRTWVAPAGQGLRVALAEAEHVSAEVRLDGAPASIELGAFRQSGDTGRLDITRDPWWILTFIVVHLGLVALPEEWFFRGYLQTRLDQRLGTRWRVLGVDIGPGLLWSALLFALLHPILIPGVHRLLVFFPALLFGWLRARTGNIGASVVVHAACNLLQTVTAAMYI